MKHLTTLDLSRTGIRSFCPSFQCLESLRTLRIDDCFNLIDISLVGKLEMLEIQSIYHSPRVQIPVSMQKLTNLKMLNASAVKSLFPKKVISSLHRLEELYLDDRGIQTELVFSEAASLTRLTCLTICLPVECMLKDFPIHWLNLSKFSIKVGKTEGLMWRDYQSTRSVSLELGSSSQNVALSIQTSNWIGALVEKIEVLEVHYHNHPSTVADLCANVLYQKVSQLYVSNCALLRYLLSATSTVTKPGKANLEKIRLHDLVNFEAICDGPQPEGFLSKLKVLHISWCRIMSILIPFHLLENLQNLEELKLSGCQGLVKLVQFEGIKSKQRPPLIFRCLRKISISNCNKLKCVFPLKAARHLMQLEVLDIWQCSNMEIVFEGDRDNGEKDKVSLPCLKTLDLVRLPSLTSFGPQDLLFDFPALIKMEIRDCGNLKSLPLFGKNNIPKLKQLEVNFGWLDWENEDESLKVHLKSLQGLVEYKDEATPQN